MPVYQLTDDLIFPHPERANKDGLLAVGGDLSPERLILAYENGIFPWFAEGDPILWWSPNPRAVLFPDDFKKSKSLTRTIKKGLFNVTFDTAFEQVIALCAMTPREYGDGTWITNSMMVAYNSLHRMGIAHSVESWQDGRLVGGLYGLSLGGTFFGESMFHLVTDASKAALWHLVDRLKQWDFDMIDVQQETPHLISMGAVAVERKKFLHLLHQSIEKPTREGSWSKD